MRPIVTLPLPRDDLHSAAPLYCAVSRWLSEHCAEPYGLRLVEVRGNTKHKDSAQIEFTSRDDEVLFCLTFGHHLVG